MSSLLDVENRVSKNPLGWALYNPWALNKSKMNLSKSFINLFILVQTESDLIDCVTIP